MNIVKVNLVISICSQFFFSQDYETLLISFMSQSQNNEGMESTFYYF